MLRTIDYINYTLEEAKRLNPTTYTGDGFGIANKIGIFKREAKGVILVIAPYNYPLNLSISKVVPASIVGNSVVIKPATNGSILGAYIGLLFAEAGFPAGTINVVTGRGSQIGDLLLTHKEVDVIAFTGSVEVGDHIKEIAQGKELILELGGKDPMLVLSDHDLARVASDIISGGLSYSGQRCTAVKLVLVLEQFADQLVALTKERMQQLKVGVASDPANFITPLIDEATAKFAEEMITEAVANGASIVTGGSRELNLMYPTLVDHVKITMRLGHIEPFAPVIPVIRCQNKTEMIEFANYSMYGLQASVYSNNITEAFQVADLLEVGTVNLNSKSQRGPDSFPFLGVKKSGVGVQGIYDSLLSMTRPKGVVINY